MTKEEWIKKFEDFDVSNLKGADDIDKAVRTLVDWANQCGEEVVGFFLLDCLRDIYFEENLTDEIKFMLDEGNNWKDAAWFLSEVDTDRSVFILGDDGRLWSMDSKMVEDLKASIIKTYKGGKQ